MSENIERNRLKELRKEAGISQQKLAAEIGISDTALQNYENHKRSIPGETLIKLVGYFGVSSDYILGVSEKRFNLDRPTTQSAIDSTIEPVVEPEVEVPLIHRIAAGTPIEMVEYENTFPIPARMHKKYPDAKLLIVDGESMNRILPNGCYALVDPCDEILHDGKLYAVCVNGYDATIKRVRKLNNGFELIPDSSDPTYVKKTYNFNEPETETITVIGQVVYYVLPYDWGF